MIGATEKRRLATALTMLPAIAFVVAATVFHTLEKRNERSTLMAEQARLSAAAIDLQMDRLLSLAGYCATSPAIVRRLDPPRFYESCGRYAEMLQAWVVVVALGEVHQQIINTRSDAPSILPSYPREDEHATLLDVEARSKVSGRPEIANVFTGKVYTDNILSTGQWIRLGDGREAMLYVSVPATAVSEQLIELAGDGDTVLGLVDPSGRVVARSRGIEKLMFTPVPLWFRDDLEAGLSGASLGMPGPDNIGGVWDTGYHPLSIGAGWMAVAVQPVSEGFVLWGFFTFANLLALLGLALTALLVGFNSHCNRAFQQLSASLQAKRAAELRSQEKSRVLASFAHDVRSPLVSMIGSLALMEKRKSTEPAEIQTARTSAESLLQMVDDILELSYLGSDSFVLNPSPIDLRRLSGELVAQANVSARQKGLTVALEIDELVPTTVKVDRLRLQQVLGNLLTNAVKYTEAGTITLRVQSEQEQGGTVDLVFAVADTGVGIGEADLEKIFREFGRLDRQIERRETGTGLGLAICKRILLAMCSELHLESKVGRGSIFSFKLHVPVAHGVEHSREAKPLSGMTILYAEDEEIIRRVTSHQLSDAGATVVEAVDGGDALEKLETLSPDLLLLDIEMPNMDGLEAIRRLQERSPDRHYPVYVLTSHIAGPKAAAARATGTDEVFTKPVQIMPLAAALLAKRGDRGNHTPSMGGADEGDDRALVELERLHLLIGANRKLFLEGHLRDFEARMSEDIARLANYIAEGDLQAAQTLSHRCLGVCLVLGATALGKRLKAIEEEAKIGDQADVAGLGVGLPDLLDRTAAAMRRVAETVTESTGTAQS